MRPANSTISTGCCPEVVAGQWYVTVALAHAGVPLPLVSYGGTQLMILLMAFGMVQSAHVSRPRG